VFKPSPINHVYIHSDYLNQSYSTVKEQVRSLPRKIARKLRYMWILHKKSVSVKPRAVPKDLTIFKPSGYLSEPAHNFDPSTLEFEQRHETLLPAGASATQSARVRLPKPLKPIHHYLGKNRKLLDSVKVHEIEYLNTPIPIKTFSATVKQREAILQVPSTKRTYRVNSRASLRILLRVYPDATLLRKRYNISHVTPSSYHYAKQTYIRHNEWRQKREVPVPEYLKVMRGYPEFVDRDAWCAFFSRFYATPKDLVKQPSISELLRKTQYKRKHDNFDTDYQYRSTPILEHTSSTSQETIFGHSFRMQTGRKRIPISPTYAFSKNKNMKDGKNKEKRVSFKMK
jgi:hypothetical protein